MVRTAIPMQYLSIIAQNQIMHVYTLWNGSNKDWKGRPADANAATEGCPTFELNCI